MAMDRRRQQWQQKRCTMGGACKRCAIHCWHSWCHCHHHNQHHCSRQHHCHYHCVCLFSCQCNFYSHPHPHCEYTAQLPPTPQMPLLLPPLPPPLPLLLLSHHLTITTNIATTATIARYILGVLFLLLVSIRCCWLQR
jgi:hypothetical protein